MLRSCAFTVLAAGTLSGLIGCTRPTSSPGRFQAAANVSDSFQILRDQKTAGPVPQPTLSQNQNQLAADHAKIAIKKSAFEKEFLLQIQMIPQATAPQFHALESRIVSFRERDGKVYLLETTQGHSFAVDLPQTLLLAQFPILNETDDTATIDFNQGMSGLFVTGELKAPDLGPNELDGDLQTVKSSFSYIEDSSFHNNKLVIQQLAQLENPQGGGFSTTEVLYYLSPYVANPKFQPTILPDSFDRVGFFAASPLVNDESGTVVYASKLDVGKPIVYAISANTPPQFKQAVKDGILYWNRALGKDLITVVDAPEGLNAPNMDFNIVQWVDWKSAGFAYADIQLDPRSGEILHQQIYFTSAWASIGSKEVQELAEMSQGAPHRILSLAGFAPSQVCDMDLNRAISDGIKPLLMNKLTADQVLKAAQDLLREVVAHEVGHTLGLRHNFAGSLAANYAPKDRENIFNEYLRTGAAPAALVTTSSVMDYQFPLESMLNGNQIAQGLPAAEYDRKAIQILYNGAEIQPENLPLFCTDSHAIKGTMADCRPYDAGSSMVEWTQYQTESQIRNLPYTLLFTYQEAKVPTFGHQPTPIASVSRDAKVIAAQYLALDKDLLGLFPQSGQLLSNSRSFDFVNGSDATVVRDHLETYILAELKRLGGLENLVSHTDLGFGEREAKRFDDLLLDPQNIQGTTSGGKPFAFSSSEIAVMKEHVHQFYQTLQTELIAQEAALLAGDKDAVPMQPSELAETFAGFLGNRATEYLMSTTASPLTVKKSSTSDSWTVGQVSSSPGVTPAVTVYTLPQFAFPSPVRQIAATFLRIDRSADPAWAFSYRMGLQSKYGDFLNNAFPPLAAATAGSDVTTEVGKYAGAPRALIEWLFDVLTIKKAL